MVGREREREREGERGRGVKSIHVDLVGSKFVITSIKFV